MPMTLASTMSAVPAPADPCAWSRESFAIDILRRFTESPRCFWRCSSQQQPYHGDAWNSEQPGTLHTSGRAFFCSASLLRLGHAAFAFGGMGGAAVKRACVCSRLWLPSAKRSPVPVSNVSPGEPPSFFALISGPAGTSY